MYISHIPYSYKTIITSKKKKSNMILITTTPGPKTKNPHWQQILKQKNPLPVLELWSENKHRLEKVTGRERIREWTVCPTATLDEITVMATFHSTIPKVGTRNTQYTHNNNPITMKNTPGTSKFKINRRIYFPKKPSNYYTDCIITYWDNREPE